MAARGPARCVKINARLFTPVLVSLGSRTMRRHFSLTVAVFLSAALIGPCAMAQNADAPSGAETSDDAAQANAADRDVPAGDAQPTPDASQPAEAKKDAGPPDPNGTWAWERTSAEFVVRLLWEDKKLTGKYSAFGSTTDIEDARFDKGDLSFKCRREFGGNQFDVHFKGKVEGDEIRGNINLDFGQGPQDFEWVAQRTVRPEDVLGVWKLRVETPNGVVEPRITITRDGEALKGAYESPFGQRDAKNVALKDGELSWEISSDDGGGQFGPFKVVYKGKPRGNSIAGKSDFDFGGNTGEATFTGKRTPPKEDASAEDGAAAAPAGDQAQDEPADSSRRPPLEEDSN
jgi:hypothetical protein